MTAALELVATTASPIATLGDPGGLLLAGPAMPAGAEPITAHEARLGPLPSLDLDALMEATSAAGLLGRGGGQFPFARKLETIRRQAERRTPAVVVNISESEPASHKDRSLVRFRPHLVLDGAALAARALGCDEVVLYLHAGENRTVASLRHAIAERTEALSWRVHVGPARYVAGEASAVLSAVEGGPALPRWSAVPAAVAGLHGRPTLLSNAETFAQLAMVVRLGPQRWQSHGPNPWNGPLLVTLNGAVRRPEEVVEVTGPATVGQVLAEIGGLTAPPAAVLIGGYAGSWVPGATAWRLPLDRAGVAEAGASIGCGLLAVVPHGVCGLAETARLVEWLAAEGAGQCGPCAFGLPRISDAMAAVAGGRSHMLDRLLNLAHSVEGRGGCRHPDGVVRLVRSALTTFADDVHRHRRGRTCGAISTGVLPLPTEAPT